VTDMWPKKDATTDKILRDDILDESGMYLTDGNDIKERAKKDLQIEKLDDPPTRWGDLRDPGRKFLRWRRRPSPPPPEELGGGSSGDGGTSKGKAKSVIMMIDCSAPEASRNIAIQRVKDIIKDSCDEEDLVGFKRLGTRSNEWVFPPSRRGNDPEGLLKQIDEANEHKGGPKLYDGIGAALDKFKEDGTGLSRWLIVLSDTVDQSTDSKSHEEIQAKLGKLVERIKEEMSDFTFAFINTYGLMPSEPQTKRKLSVSFPSQAPTQEQMLQQYKRYDNLGRPPVPLQKRLDWWEAAVKETLTKQFEDVGKEIDGIYAEAKDPAALNKAMEKVKEAVIKKKKRGLRMGASG